MGFANQLDHLFWLWLYYCSHIRPGMAAYIWTPHLGPKERWPRVLGYPGLHCETMSQKTEDISLVKRSITNRARLPHSLHLKEGKHGYRNTHKEVGVTWWWQLATFLLSIPSDILGPHMLNGLGKIQMTLPFTELQILSCPSPQSFLNTVYSQFVERITPDIENARINCQVPRGHRTRLRHHQLHSPFKVEKHMNFIKGSKQLELYLSAACTQVKPGQPSVEAILSSIWAQHRESS